MASVKPKIMAKSVAADGIAEVQQKTSPQKRKIEEDTTMDVEQVLYCTVFWSTN